MTTPRRPRKAAKPVRGASRSCASAPITSGRCRRRTNARSKPPPSRGTFVESSKVRKVRRPHTSALILEGRSSRRRSPMKPSTNSSWRRTISVCCHQRLGRNGRNRLSIECCRAAADMIELPLHPQTGHARRPAHRSVLRGAHPWISRFVARAVAGINAHSRTRTKATNANGSSGENR
jgi:hypothetical protein